ncbi:MAG: hypothetical protein GX916_08605 [Clostridiales bacterium]|jgi:hypothetical protein|nr:hypothetical protein [Clostridiales bacterium]
MNIIRKINDSSNIEGQVMVITVLMFSGITATGILYGERLFRILLLYISLIVMLRMMIPLSAPILSVLTASRR